MNINKPMRLIFLPIYTIQSAGKPIEVSRVNNFQELIAKIIYATYYRQFKSHEHIQMRS